MREEHRFALLRKDEERLVGREVRLLSVRLTL